MLVSVKNSSNELVGLWCGGPLCAKKSRDTFLSVPGAKYHVVGVASRGHEKQLT